MNMYIIEDCRRKKVFINIYDLYELFFFSYYMCFKDNYILNVIF